jgi:hypothetical protein
MRPVKDPLPWVLRGVEADVMKAWRKHALSHREAQSLGPGALRIRLSIAHRRGQAEDYRKR